MMLLRISHHQQGVLVSGKQGEKQKEGKENHGLVDKVFFWQDLLMFAEYSVNEAREGNNLLPDHDLSHTPLSCFKGGAAAARETPCNWQPHLIFGVLEKQ